MLSWRLGEIYIGVSGRALARINPANLFQSRRRMCLWSLVL